MRHPKIGEIGIVIIDDEGEGANIGKQCVPVQQCSCHDTRWECEALEPHVMATMFGTVRCDPGDKVCYGKTHLIVKEDPDESRSEDGVREVRLDGVPDFATH